MDLMMPDVRRGKIALVLGRLRPGLGSIVPGLPTCNCLQRRPTYKVPLILGRVPRILGSGASLRQNPSSGAVKSTLLGPGKGLRS